ncbi:MAG: hypothetical protein GC147_01740 [Porphyrobacter sp.]|nr:hypothetical protein [Porphyrobacter sp.]
MAVPETQADPPPPAARRRLWPRRWRTRFAAGGAVVALAAGSVAWFDRERIAGNVIDDYLAQSGVPATYDIVSIGPRRQVIANLVVGDPAHPDFTAKAMVVELGVGWQGPELRRVTLDGARLYASYRGGAFSLGALDPLVFTGSTAPSSLPAIDVTFKDARALLESDYGKVGIKLEGSGRLDDGFSGTLAATAPGIGAEGCHAATATLYGALTTARGAPHLEGPLRLSGLDCGGARLARADIGTSLTLARDFTGADGELAIRGKGASYGDVAGEGLGGTARITWSDKGLVLAHDLVIEKVSAPQVRLARLAAEGSWKGSADAARGTWQGQLSGAGLTADRALTATLAEAGTGLEGTLLAPLLAKAQRGWMQALADADFSAEAVLRTRPEGVALTIPAASLSARSGERVAALSAVSLGLKDGALSGLRGNLLLGGAGLPAIDGRIVQEPAGGWTMRLGMAEYREGANRLAVPRLTLRQEPGGTIRFTGLATASGALPGGSVSGLEVPIEGRWSQASGLAAGTACTPLRFGALALAGLALPGEAITLCPEAGAPLIAYKDGLRIAARTGPLELAGTLGDSPARFAAESLALRYPEPFVVTGLSARIGTPGSQTQLTAASLTGSLADAIGGSFAGGTARLDAVPLDLSAMAGRWSVADGALRIDQGTFTLADRPAQGPARFVPLAARGGTLTLADGKIRAAASLRHPASDRLVAEVTVDHDLATARGGARLAVPGLVFDKGLQPEDLSYLAADLIVFADGTITGDGRIDWTGEDVTSSGSFASEGFDFGAPFGPVRGLAGRVVFTDLLNLTTASDQTLTVAAINPGVEVLAGKLRFDLRDGTLFDLKDARFPFMGGELILRPLVMDFSKPEERRYVFEIVGLDAARFVAQMELTNLAASGTFDGTVPVVFDADGNGRIEGGLLLSRPPGGNVAYVGELTYEDLGTMGNYAFQALRSLDYRQMSVGLNGSLGGEIITNFDFEGVRQGEGASQNFVTRKIARLPIRFRVNVRSENFYQLATMVRSFWDVDSLGSPVDRGLIKVENGRFVPARPAVLPVQPPESEDQP